MTKISKYLNPDLVVFLDVSTRDDALQAMVERLGALGKLNDQKIFLNAILEREKIVSTGIGMGVAIPHAKLPDYDDFFIAIGILQKGIDWCALDHAPVRLIFMIGGPDDKQTEYLQILSNLTNAVKNADKRKKMLSLTSPQSIIDLFSVL